MTRGADTLFSIRAEILPVEPDLDYTSVGKSKPIPN